jgi:hypothetical protein
VTAADYAREWLEDVDFTKDDDADDVLEAVQFVMRAIKLYGREAVFGAMREADLDPDELIAWTTVIERQECGVPLRRVPRCLRGADGFDGITPIAYHLVLAPRVANA